MVTSMTLEQIEEFPILNREHAVYYLEDAEVFDTIIEGYSETKLKRGLNSFKAALEAGDFNRVALESQALKNCAIYIQAQRTVAVARAIYESCVPKLEVDAICQYYPILIKQSILLRRRIRQEIFQKNKLVFNEDNDADFDVPIAKQYKLDKRSFNDFDVSQVENVEIHNPIVDLEYPSNKVDEVIVMDKKLPLMEPKKETLHVEEEIKFRDSTLLDRSMKSSKISDVERFKNQRLRESIGDITAVDDEEYVEEKEIFVKAKQKDDIIMNEKPKLVSCNCSLL